jgi:UDP-2,3-diacylglucosamine pyrophosphatase LpxH
MSERRRVEVLVLSDIHLGYHGCRAKELLGYLKTIAPERIILNGDIFDIWQFSKSFWPESHLKVILRLLKYSQQGIPIHYVTGNHDEALRRYSPFLLGTVELVDRLELQIDGKRHWFLHGDAFDALLATPRWLQWMGGMSYEAVSFISAWLNRGRTLLGLSRISPATYCKQHLASAARHIAHFEELCARMAAERGCEVIVCGHIHAASNRLMQVPHCERTVEVLYLNSGDWVDSCTALEYVDKQWSVAHVRDLLSVNGLDETAAVGEAGSATIVGPRF